MPTGAQIRAARGLLGISAKDLAVLADIGWATVQRIESSDGTGSRRSGTLERVKAALEGQGIEFLGDATTSPGVRLHRTGS
jgi:predicted transcriptional regulator